MPGGFFPRRSRPRVRSRAGDFLSSGAQNLAPPLVTNTQTFFAAAVTAVNTVAPPLVTNAQSFPVPVVTGANAVAPPLVTNVAVIYAPTVFQGATVLPPLLVNSNGFPGATVSTSAQTLQPPLVDASAVVFAPGVQRTIYPPVVDNSANEFFPASVSYTIRPGLLNAAASIFAPKVGRTLNADDILVVNQQVFFAPNVTTKNNLVQATRFDDPDIFFGFIVGHGQFLVVGGVLVNASQIFSPTVKRIGFNSMSARLNGSFAAPFPYARKAGVWTPVEEVWVHDSGSWEQVYARSD